MLADLRSWCRRVIQLTFRSAPGRPRQGADVAQSAQEGLGDVEPFDCPACSGRLAASGDEYVCAGLANAEEVRRYLAPRLPAALSTARITAVKPCGWRGRAADYQVTWA